MAHAYVPHHNAGAETTMHSELRHFAARGHRVDVLVSRPSVADTVYEVDGVFVHPFRSSGDPFRWFGTEQQPDVVIAHLENTPRAAALCDIYGVPMVHLIHNTHEFTKGALRRGPSQFAVFNTEWMRKNYENYFAWVGGRMPPHTVVLPPVTPADYSGQRGDRITLINLNEDKGGELFWRLAAALPARKFLAVKGAYGEQIVPEQVPANVEVVEHLAPCDMHERVYARTKLLLMPSGYESYGRVGIEAAHSGIPTIAHPTPGLLEALGPAGTFCDRDDPAAWVAAINRLLVPGNYAAASKAALALAAALTPEADLDRLTDALEGVVRRGFALAR